jgi:hypothetical protein
MPSSRSSALKVSWKAERSDRAPLHRRSRRNHLDQNRTSDLRKRRARTLRPYRYLTLPKESRENPHLVRERVRCGKHSCRRAQDVRRRHGPYLYLRYEEFDPRTGRAATGASTFRRASWRGCCGGSGGPGLPAPFSGIHGVPALFRRVDGVSRQAPRPDASLLEGDARRAQWARYGIAVALPDVAGVEPRGEDEGVVASLGELRPDGHSYIENPGLDLAGL